MFDLHRRLVLPLAPPNLKVDQQLCVTCGPEIDLCRFYARPSSGAELMLIDAMSCFCPRKITFLLNPVRNNLLFKPCLNKSFAEAIMHFIKQVFGKSYILAMNALTGLACDCSTCTYECCCTMLLECLCSFFPL